MLLGDLREQSRRFRALGVGERALDDGPVARADRPHEDDDGEHGQQAGTEPQQQRHGVELRLVQHEGAVTLDHVVDDFLVGLARLDLLVHLATQVDRQFRVRLGDRLVLADQAAQLRGQFDSALGRDRIEVGRRGVGGERPERQGEHQQMEEHEEALHDFRSSSISGSIFRVHTSSVIGPICL